MSVAIKSLHWNVAQVSPCADRMSFESFFVAFYALRGCVAIGANQLHIRPGLFLMALFAANVAMGAVERKLTAVVIEVADLPAGRCVAGRAVFRAPGYLELASMCFIPFVTTAATVIRV